MMYKFIAIGLFMFQIAYSQIYFWTGALRPNSIKINVFNDKNYQSITVVYSSKSDFSNVEKSTTNSPKNGITNFELNNLKEHTTYYYKFEVDGKISEQKAHQGKFTTPSSKPFTYQFVTGSCNFFPNNDVYSKMLKQEPLFYLMPGDLHYANPSSSDPAQHFHPYIERVLSQEKEGKFFAQVPFAYVWDDHDFCGDNNESNINCGSAAKKAYLDFVPYYDIKASKESNAIYQSFTIGRVKYILCDLRSERLSGDIISNDQMNWLKTEILDAKEKKFITAWVTSVSYSGTIKDNWGGFISTRENFANFLHQNEIQNLFIISGDAHMIAVDNGTNADFTTQKKQC